MSMKKLPLFATGLFVLHTAEETVSAFSQTDWEILSLSKFLTLNVEIVYWLIQLVLYVFLFVMLSSSSMRIERIANPLLGVILLYEFHHSWTALSIGTYTPGLYTGLLLSLFGLYFWFIYIKTLLQNEI